MNNLAKNIRHLRKQQAWSQEELSGRINVKRSSIAAYESKNVEPRLKVILKLAKLFDVSISDLIERDIAMLPKEELKSFEVSDTTIRNTSLKINFEDSEALKEFISTTMNTRKMLDGLKVFYKFKIKNAEKGKPTFSSDVNSFIMLVEHLLDNNEVLVNSLTKTKAAQA